LLRLLEVKVLEKLAKKGKDTVIIENSGIL